MEKTMGNMGIWQLLIVLAIIVVLFGTKKLRGMGSDLGGAVKGFKKAISDDKDVDKDMAEQIQKSENATPTEPTNTDKTKDNNKA